MNFERENRYISVLQSTNSFIINTLLVFHGQKHMFFESTVRTHTSLFVPEVEEYTWN